jgi:hypothetical protein
MAGEDSATVGGAVAVDPTSATVRVTEADDGADAVDWPNEDIWKWSAKEAGTGCLARYGQIRIGASRVSSSIACMRVENRSICIRHLRVGRGDILQRVSWSREQGARGSHEETIICGRDVRRDRTGGRGQGSRYGRSSVR